MKRFAVFCNLRIIYIYLTYKMTCKILFKVNMKWNLNYFKNDFLALFFTRAFLIGEKSAQRQISYIKSIADIHVRILHIG
jgi:hypothetical protein